MERFLDLLLFWRFINSLCNDIKSVIKLFADDVKLLVWPLSKETQMDLNKLSYWDNFWKLRFNVEKCEVLHIVFKSITVEYKLNNREIKKVNEECNLRVGFDDKFKANNHILSIGIILLDD